MTTAEEVFRALQEPFPVKFLSWTVIATNKEKTDALVSPYIGAHHIMARFDDVLGPLNWQTGLQGQVGYLIKGIGIRIGKSKDWVWRWEPGVFEATRSTNVRRIEILGSATVGLRRAAIEWGVGRYLKFITAPWVGYDSHTKKIRETPNIENQNFWWALPYDHPAAVDKWNTKNGHPIEDLGKDDDAPEIEEVKVDPKKKLDKEPIDLDEYFGDEEGHEEIVEKKDDTPQKHNYGDFMRMAVHEMGWEHDQAKRFLEDNKAKMTPDQMVADLNEAVKKGLGVK